MIGLYVDFWIGSNDLIFLAITILPFLSSSGKSRINFLSVNLRATLSRLNILPCWCVTVPNSKGSGPSVSLIFWSAISDERLVPDCLLNFLGLSFCIFPQEA